MLWNTALPPRGGERGSRTVMGFQEADSQVREGQYGQGFRTIGVVRLSALSHGSENHLRGEIKEQISCLDRIKLTLFIII